MPVFKLPLSGDVVQSINPITSFFSPAGGQFAAFKELMHSVATVKERHNRKACRPRQR